MGQRGYFTTFQVLFFLVLRLEISKAELSQALSYTILKLHTFKIVTENCKNQYQVDGRYVQGRNKAFSLGLMENCSNCQTLTMEQHLIRLHKVFTKFVNPIMAVYKFEKERNNGDIQKCVAKVQYVLFTLKILSEMQVSPDKLRQHNSLSVGDLKLKTKKYLESTSASLHQQVSDNEVMKEFCSTLMKELFVTSIVIQKDRVEIQNLAQ